MPKRAKVGDVLEVEAPGGRIYLHYLGVHPDYGAAIKVCPTLHPERADVTEQLFRDGYVTFYPASVAVHRGLAKIVGHLPAPEMPRRFRRAGAMIGTEVKTWIIEDGPDETLRYQLSDDELHLPIAAIWNHEYLIESVMTGWRPEHEGQ